MPLDFDGDGNIDLIVGCPDHPYNGTYLFRNIGTNAKPLFDRAQWLGPERRTSLRRFQWRWCDRTSLSAAATTATYAATVCRSSSKSNSLANYHIGRDDLWYPVDWDGDGKIDILAGVSDWRDYGWDDAFNPKGEWTRGHLSRLRLVPPQYRHK